MSAKKIYTLQINGIDKGIKDLTSLDEVIKKVDNSFSNLNKQTLNASDTINKSTQATKQRTTALTEEEKEEQKLAAAIDKVVQARTTSNKAIIEANLKAREVTREVTREIQINQLAEGSIKQIGMQLTDLRNKYENLSASKRKDINEGGELLRQIQALDKEYKGLRESTGNFRDSVGDYKKATTSLEKLGSSIDNVSQTSMGLAQSLLAVNQLMALFGNESDENTKQSQQLQKVLALLGLALSINNSLIKSGVIATKASTIAETIHTSQVNARAMAISLSTKNTISATIAQKAFNLVAKANPYVLLATAILAVVGGLAAYSTNAKDATETTDKYKSSIDNVTFASKEARDAHDELSRKIRDIQIDIDVATGKLSKYEAAILRVKNAGKDALDEINKEEQEKLDQLKEDHLDFFNNVGWLAKNAFTTWDTSFSEKRLKEYLDKQGKIFEDYNHRRNLQNKATEDALQKQAAETAAEVKKRNEDVNNDNLEGIKGTLAKIQTERLREEQNAIDQNKIIEEANKTRNKNEKLALNDLSAINLKYDKKREEAIKSANKTAADAGKAAQDRRKADLEKQKAALEKERDLIRKAEDDKTALITNEYDRRREETRFKYERQREDLEKQLKEDKDLTAEGQNAIRAIIANINAHWEAEDKKTHEDELKDREQKEKEAEVKRKELLDKRIADSDRRNSLLLSGLDIALEQAQQKIGEVVTRDKDGLQLINIDQTRKNYKDANDALDEYIAGLIKAQDEIRLTHEETIKDLKAGTPEYEEELQKYAEANLQLNNDLKDANKQREANTKASNDVLTDYFREMFAKIGQYAQAASMAITSVMDTLSMGLDMQIENLNEQLEEVTERYDEVVKLREQSTERVEDLEERLRAATGGTAEALKEQLQSEMHARGELEREEARLQKEKEKREAEIAKKEKQQKKADLTSSIAQANANVASAIIQALDAAPPPFNFALAALVGAAGAIQIGMMTKQLTKLEDGGIINGPSHANGGARIQGTNIEVEGGEYVVNKTSTAANTKLIEFINNTRSTITAADLVGLVPGEANTPVIINNQSNGLDYEALADAMANIHIEPKVAVTDIIDVSDDVVNVRDIAGF